MTASDGSKVPAATATPKAPDVVEHTATDLPPRPLLARWTTPASRARRILFATMVYVVCTSTFATIAGPERLLQHTAFNHYALLANAWLHGHQNLPDGPPAYTQNNDFAEYGGKTYVSFPPFPAALMLPFVKLAGSAEDFRDGQFVIWLAGLAPAVLFLVLEKLRRTARSSRSERENVVLSLLFAFGTVYFFTAVEGTVWFAALVVAAALQALYVLFALDADQPLLAGAMLGCAYLTRPPVLSGAILFALEALRVSARGGLATDGPWGTRIRESLTRIDFRSLGRRYLLFAAPIVAAFAVVAWMNWTRYARATPIYFDHEFLTVAWRDRMHKWGGCSATTFWRRTLALR